MSALGYTHTFFPGSKIVEISHFPFVTKQETIMESHSEPGLGIGKGRVGTWWAAVHEDISHPSRTLADLGLFKDSRCRG